MLCLSDDESKKAARSLGRDFVDIKQVVKVQIEIPLEDVKYCRVVNMSLVPNIPHSWPAHAGGAASVRHGVAEVRDNNKRGCACLERDLIDQNPNLGDDFEVRCYFRRFSQIAKLFGPR
ncbi:hypothetical protein SELMODRAFT_451458 [Selaginella moellendorffii]|uniref:Uncharacterized protein n=1 Tax=Selaginella moellendorffii TaxID=88036 RepID=D8SS07_SELML|nr:hypothetical protein SELMODRAFT_451458 [Selaginella moellendorffii]